MNIDNILKLMEQNTEHQQYAMFERKLADDSEANSSADLAEFVATLKESKKDNNPFHEPAGSRKGGQFASKSGGSVASEDIPSHEDQVKAHTDIRNYLTQMDHIRRSNNLPSGMDSVEGFLLKNGKDYFVNAQTYAGARDTPKMCYMNATLAVLNNNDRTYVEGYITTHGVPIQHAWTVDKAGQVYDSTINPKNGRIASYFGIPFSSKYVLESSVKNKIYGLLGYASRKTLVPLLEGKTTNFKDGG
jgi:hypothetical protein